MFLTSKSSRLDDALPNYHSPDNEYRSDSGHFPIYSVATNPIENDKASEIKLPSFARPHMRAFHMSWMSFFIAFFGWFAIPPLMPTIKRELRLSKDQVADTNIASVASTILARTVTGPLCDKYGCRTIQTVILVLGAIPVACAGLTSSYEDILVTRLAIGLVGASFIATASWTSAMFASNVVGTANALAAGWGNLGAGVTYLVSPLLFDLVTLSTAVSDDLGWRITLVFPALMMLAISFFMYKYSDDCPQGNYKDIETVHHRPVDSDPARSSLWSVLQSPAVWVLSFQYACSFGVELQVHNVLGIYYYEDFVKAGCQVTAQEPCRVLSQTQSSLISSLFGFMCLFARAAGGYLSDVANTKFGMQGRLLAQVICFFGQTVFLLCFANATSVGLSVPFLILFGVCVQACTGTTYAIVPFVDPSATGTVSGVVGAGGNVGGLCWGFLFKTIVDSRKSFMYLSAFVLAAALSTVGIKINE